MEPILAPGIDAMLSVQPDFQFIRSYREYGTTVEATAHRQAENYSSAGTIRFLSFFHDDTSTTASSYDYHLRDLHAQFTPTRHLPAGFDVSLMSCIGWALQNSTGAISRENLFDRTLYGQAAPSVAWMPHSGGRVEIEYVFSLVDVPASHDYRIARGFSSGVSHTISVIANVRAGKYFMVNGSYRGELYGNGSDQPDEHVMSLEVQAFLQ